MEMYYLKVKEDESDPWTAYSEHAAKRNVSLKSMGLSSIQQETHTEIDILFPGDPKETQIRAEELDDRKLISYFFAGQSSTVS